MTAHELKMFAYYVRTIATMPVHDRAIFPVGGTPTGATCTVEHVRPGEFHFNGVACGNAYGAADTYARVCAMAFELPGA